jgi:hypothetical protein
VARAYARYRGVANARQGDGRVGVRVLQSAFRATESLKARPHGRPVFCNRWTRGRQRRHGPPDVPMGRRVIEPLRVGIEAVRIAIPSRRSRPMNRLAVVWRIESHQCGDQVVRAVCSRFCRSEKRVALPRYRLRVS